MRTIKRISELYNKERTKLVQRINEVMRDEFDIFPDDINSFWEYLLFSVRYGKASKDAYEKVLKDAC